jgi:hypothetical protein
VVGGSGRGPASKAGTPTSRPRDWLERASWRWAGSGMRADTRAVEPTGRQPPQGCGPVLVGRPEVGGGSGRRQHQCG